MATDESAKKSPVPAAAPKASKPRSPGYPFVSLPTAIERVRAFWQAERRNTALLASIGQHWGYGAKSSGLRLTASALVKYGLMAVEGEGRYKLTDAAIQIAGRPDGDAAAAPFIKAAALKPAVYADLWKRYGDSTANDQALFVYLTVDRSFLDDAARDVVKDFRATVTFAKLTNEDKAPDSAVDTDDQGAEGEDSMGSATLEDPMAKAERTSVGSKPPVVPGWAPMPQAQPPAPTGLSPYPLLLRSGKMFIYHPQQITAADFKLLQTQIASFLAVAEATLVVADPPPAAST